MRGFQPRRPDYVDSMIVGVIVRDRVVSANYIGWELGAKIQLPASRSQHVTVEQKEASGGLLMPRLVERSDTLPEDTRLGIWLKWRDGYEGLNGRGDVTFEVDGDLAT